MACCFGNEEDEKKYFAKRSREHRGRCTDCICFLIFIVFLSGMGITTTLTVLDHGFERLVYGYDSDGNICNNKNDFQSSLNNETNVHRKNTLGLNYVFYFNYSDPLTARKVCVKSCPDRNINNKSEYINYTSTSDNSLCMYDVKKGLYDPEKCPKFPIATTIPVVNRCVPDIKQLILMNNPNYASFLEGHIDQSAELAKLYIVQLYTKLPEIGLLSLASLLVTIILVFLLRYIANIVIYLIMLAASLGSISFSGFLWFRFYEVFASGISTMTALPIIGTVVELSTSYAIYATITTVLTCILLLLIFTMRKQVGLVIRLIVEAQKTLADMPMLFALPFVAFFWLILFLVYWSITAMMIYSFGEYNHDILSARNMPMEKSQLLVVMWVYHAVALIWVSEFIFACQAMTVSGAVARWYFTRNKKADLGTPICASLKRTFVFHMGSVAYGSFIITLIRFPRYCLIALQNKIKTAQPGSCTASILKVFTCCLWFLENVMQYINQNAYTIIAIEGVPFCTATKKAFHLIMKNVLRIAMINSVGDFLLLLCKIAVAAISLAIAFVWFQIPLDNYETMKTSLLPLILVAIIGYLIAHCFFTVYEMVIDALMICFCEDIEANDGSEERPYYMSSSLKKFIEASEQTHIIINKD